MIGQGTFASVCKAHDTELDRVIAVKIPRNGEFHTERDATRFLREARHVAKLRHPGIVTVHEVGRIDGLCFLVFDYIAGTTLAEEAARGPIAPPDSARVVARIADALDHAHGRGIIHRDVKPSNILLDSEGNPHVTDFGLARRVAGEATRSADGKIRGTPAYMAAEQVQGDCGLVDARSDIYSLGVVLYELLTGEVPFQGSLRMVLLQNLEEDPRPPRRCDESIPRDLETVCLKAMAKEPSRRYPTAAALAADLWRFIDGQPGQARPSGRTFRLMRWCRRRPRLAAMAATVFLAIAGMAWQWWRAEVNLVEAARQQKRFRDALESSSQVTSSILKMAVEPSEAGSIDEAAQLNTALDHMKHHIALVRDDPKSRRTLALAYGHTSTLLRKAGRSGPAMETMKQMEAAWTEALGQHSNMPRSMLSLADTYCQLVELVRDDLAPDQMERLFKQGTDLYQAAAPILHSRSAAAIATRGDRQRRLNDCLRMGKFARNLGREDDAIAWFSEALACWEAVRDASAPGCSPARQSYFTVQWELASLRSKAGRPIEAIPHFLVVRDLRAEDVRAHPEDLLAREQLASTCYDLGLARRDSGQIQDAVHDFEQARRLLEESSADSSLARLKQLRRINVEIGRIEDHAGQYALAIQSFRRAKVLNQVLAAQDPADPKSRLGLAMCDHVIGNLNCDLGQFADAVSSFQRAMELEEALVRDFPGNTKFASDLNGTRRRLADARRALAGK